jgi:signal transduction histidine kinase
VNTLAWRHRPSAPLRAPLVALDVAVAVVAFAAWLLLLHNGAADPGGSRPRSLDALGVALAAAGSLPLMGWRRSPTAVFVTTALAGAVLNALGYPLGPPIGPTVALYLFALGRDDREPASRSLLLMSGLLALHVGAAGLGRDAFPAMPLLFGVVVWTAAWLAGDRTRLRRQRLLEREERMRRAERDVERERRLAAAEERTRIARDLHDSAGHAINVILVEAGAARLLRDRDPQRALQALETIEDVARETLSEIDQLVRVLRDRPGHAGDEVEPPRGVSTLAGLAARHRAAGLDVELRAHGTARRLSPAVDQAAYRIVQEALTNAARHGSGPATVDLRYATGAIELTVVNPILPAEAESAVSAGHGLVGMHERVALLGGTLKAGRRDGAFHVKAHLPDTEHVS